MRVVLERGAHSTVFIDNAEPGIVIKEPNDPENRQFYLQKQGRGYEIVQTIKDINRDTGVMLPELVEINNHEIREKIIPGKSFKNVQMYAALPEKQKNNIAKQMATFLNVMHSSYECRPAKESIKNIFDGRRLNDADDIIAAFDGFLPKDIAIRLKKAEEYISKSNISDEVIVMTHKDLRTQNIMYDKDTGKIAVIDFELAGLDNVYRDFVAVAPASSMPWNFTKRVIDFYNKIPNKKYPIKINPEKVQNMLLYGAMHEWARCIDPNENRYSDAKNVAMLYKKIQMLTGMNLGVAAGFEKGTNKVQSKIRTMFGKIFGHSNN